MEAICCRIFGCIARRAVCPIITLRPVTAQSASVAETNIVTGAAYFAASAAVANCVRSPHSAMKITVKADAIVGTNRPRPFAATFTASADETRCHIHTASSRNNKAAAMWTSFSGRKVNNDPKLTATTLWTTNAPAAPQKTGSARFRVARSKLAKAVLSGSSDMKIRANVEPKSFQSIRRI